MGILTILKRMIVVPMTMMIWMTPMRRTKVMMTMMVLIMTMMMTTMMMQKNMQNIIAARTTR